jgi:4-carboxymuconolactone decarboxylase
MEVLGTVRLEPLQPPYTPEVEHTLERMMPPGVDQVHDTAGVSDELWSRLRSSYSEPQLVELVELVTLAGQYHAISFVANAFGVEPEEAAARFPE